MVKYKDFIPENVATKSAKRIGVYDSVGKRLFGIPLGNLVLPSNRGKKLYSFGSLSDVHIGDNTSESDLTTALKFLSTETDFICICGDLIHDGNSTTQRATYKSIVDTHAKVPVYACAGNHDAYNTNIENDIESYSGRPLYYSITKENDVFIFIGCNSNSNGNLFTKAELQWLYETLEANRNKRCFLYEHVRPDDACGNALGIYTYDIWGGTEVTVFESLLRHYTNTIFVHGHSHLKFDLQQYSNKANVDRIFGCWSIHNPSITVPRGTDSVINPSRVELYAESEGYVVDVYKNGIHLRGRDFIKGEFLPIASYWLDTTPVKIEANTYEDPTGIIFKGNTVNGDTIVVNWNEGVSISSNGTIQSQSEYTTSDLIAIEDGYTYTVYGSDVKGFSIYPQWYKADMSYIGVGQIADGHGWSSSATGNVTYVVNPPSEAKYFRLQGWVGTNMGVLASNVTVKRTITT